MNMRWTAWIQVYLILDKWVKKRVPWKEELVKKKSSELNKAYLKNKRLPNSGNATYLKQWDNGKELISYRLS